MNRTREDFCRKLLDDDSPHDTLNPEGMAAGFVRYFRLSGRPAMDELRSMLRRAGFGEVTGRDLDVKGIHYSALGGGYASTTGTTCGTAGRSTRCSTRPTRSSTRPSGT